MPAEVAEFRRGAIRYRERKRIKEIIRQQLWMENLITLGQWSALDEAIDDQKENK
jgi:hypothetical protein